MKPILPLLVAMTLLFAAAPMADAAVPAVGLPTRSHLRITGPASAALAGAAVASVGDVNGDGIGDVALSGLAAGTSGSPSAQKVWIVFGTAKAATVDLAHLGNQGITIIDPYPGDRFGEAVAGVGDVNGDGLADVGIGAPEASYLGRRGAGSVTIVYGRRAATTIHVERLGAGGEVVGGANGDDFFGPGTHLGGSISNVGDIDGDGRGDLGFGSEMIWSQDRPTAFVVPVSVLNGGLDLSTLGDRGLSLTVGLYAYDPSPLVVSGIGDVNGDGRADLGLTRIEGTRLTYGPGPAAWVVFGHSGGGLLRLGYLGDRGYQIVSRAPGEVGGAIAPLGDIRSDGHSSFAIGASGLGNGAGGAYVLYGHADNHTVDLDNLGGDGKLLTGAVPDAPMLPGDHSGSTLAAVVRPDGAAVLAIGSPLASPAGHRTAGAIDLVDRAGLLAGGPIATASILRLNGTQTGAEAGHALAPDISAPDSLLVSSWLADSTKRDAAGQVDQLRLDSVNEYPPATHSQSGPKFLATGTAVLGDRSRWAVLTARDGQITVLDTAHNRSKTLALQPGCTVNAVRLAKALVVCAPTGALASYGAARRPIIVNLATGHATQLKINGSVDPDADWYTLGRYWISGPAGCYHCTTNYLNIKTGEVRYGPTDIDDDGKELNLDSPKLSPVKASSANTELVDGYGLRLSSSKHPVLLLIHGKHHVRLSRCSTTCRDVELGGGRATWVQGRVVHSYTVSTHHFRSWAIPLPERAVVLPSPDYATTHAAAATVDATHTRHELLVTTGGYVPGGTAETRLYAIRW